MSGILKRNSYPDFDTSFVQMYEELVSPDRPFRHGQLPLEGNRSALVRSLRAVTRGMGRIESELEAHFFQREKVCFYEYRLMGADQGVLYRQYAGSESSAAMEENRLVKVGRREHAPLKNLLGHRMIEHFVDRMAGIGNTVPMLFTQGNIAGPYLERLRQTVAGGTDSSGTDSDCLAAFIDETTTQDLIEEVFFLFAFAYHLPAVGPYSLVFCLDLGFGLRGRVLVRKKKY